MIVVADREHHRLQYFTIEGKLDHLVTNERPEQDKDDTGKFRRPCHFSQRGSEMLIPDLKGRVTVLDKDNNVIVQLGDNPNPHQRANNGVKAADLVPGAFLLPARRHVGPRREHLRCRVAPLRPGDEAAARKRIKNLRFSREAIAFMEGGALSHSPCFRPTRGATVALRVRAQCHLPRFHLEHGYLLPVNAAFEVEEHLGIERMKMGGADLALAIGCRCGMADQRERLVTRQRHLQSRLPGVLVRLHRYRASSSA